MYIIDKRSQLSPIRKKRLTILVKILILKRFRTFRKGRLKLICTDAHIITCVLLMKVNVNDLMIMLAMD